MINFLVDTGADTTCLMPADVFALRLRERDWGDQLASRGIGGEVSVYENHATLMFLDLGVGLVVYDIPIYVYPNQKPYDEYPSLLGRDVLDMWRMQYSYPDLRLAAEAVRHDLLISLPISPTRPG